MVANTPHLMANRLTVNERVCYEQMRKHPKASLNGKVVSNQGEHFRTVSRLSVTPFCALAKSHSSETLRTFLHASERVPIALTNLQNDMKGASHDPL